MTGIVQDTVDPMLRFSGSYRKHLGYRKFVSEKSSNERVIINRSLDILDIDSLIYLKVHNFSFMSRI